MGLCTSSKVYCYPRSIVLLAVETIAFLPPASHLFAENMTANTTPYAISRQLDSNGPIAPRWMTSISADRTAALTGSVKVEFSAMAVVPSVLMGRAKRGLPSISADRTAAPIGSARAEFKVLAAVPSVFTVSALTNFLLTNFRVDSNV